MIKTRKVAIDDGHGLETAGKRTPTLPDGMIMKENEFNRRVAQLLAAHLVRSGVDVLMVAPSDLDTPLSVRTDTANKAKVDFYISIHANAYGAGGFNSVRGIETFHYTNASENSKRAARIIHKHLLEGTKLPDRGVKTADFQVLRETTMPAVLVECGFMTNIEEARWLLTEIYRAECALEIAKGICEYLGAPFVEAIQVPHPSTTTGFTDVPDNHWAKASIEKAAKSGVLAGVAPGVFGLGQTITREQLAVILDRVGLLEKGGK